VPNWDGLFELACRDWTFVPIPTGSSAFSIFTFELVIYNEIVTYLVHIEADMFGVIEELCWMRFHKSKSAPLYRGKDFWTTNINNWINKKEFLECLTT
jgi:hypothetical protein